jgi:glutamate-1-semialdehyde aminotransferase
MVSMLLTKTDVGPITNYRDMRRHLDPEKFIRLQHQLQTTAVFFHPNQFEPMFLSTAHTSQDIATVLERLEDGARSVLLA